MAKHGIRFIGGREYLLAGKYNYKDDAQEAAKVLRDRWQSVKVIKTGIVEYTIWVHGYLENPPMKRYVLNI